MKLLFFDTETTSVRPGHICQLSYITVDTSTKPQTTIGKNFFFTVDEMDPAAQEVHGFSLEKLYELSNGLEFLEQIQDFTPTPMTVSTETWYTGFHPYTLEPIFSAKTQREKLSQRMFFFWYKPEERRNIINELRKIGRQDLIDKLYGKR